MLPNVRAIAQEYHPWRSLHGSQAAGYVVTIPTPAYAFSAEFRNRPLFHQRRSIRIEVPVSQPGARSTKRDRMLETYASFLSAAMGCVVTRELQPASSVFTGRPSWLLFGHGRREVATEVHFE